MNKLLNEIKDILSEFNTKYIICIAIILCIITATITYMYIPTLIDDAIQKRKEYDKKHHLGWYSYSIINDKNNYNINI